ncbi:thioredoxin domain-containing protein [Pseudonocardia xinjiangensis]|uniref:Thioredoxin domain-containing protein n=2 Tax=Pseudonocardia xinjiangensis TaxID=75289 RepID=A0ABX1RLY5_9PSEU|nr:thioredoxin domain-containing protein [Pseudonocardia xinjiangensis]
MKDRAARLSSPRSVSVVTATRGILPSWEPAPRQTSLEVTIALDPRMGTYDHLQGVLGAELSLVEYGDFECPYCRKAAPVIEEVRERLGTRLVFAFRHFPLAELHPFALSAAVAAEAAAVKGQFWPMHDRLFSGDEPRLRQEDLRRYAEEIGVPPEKVVWPATQFVEERVEADFNSGVRSGVRGTPTLFVNGAQYRGAVTVRDLVEALET